jgi:TRAP-type C4-dicarboxylate transport system substrate-binding protein
MTAKPTTTSRQVLATLVAGLGVLSCGGDDGDRAGGPSRSEPVVLVMAQPSFGPPAPRPLELWAQEVERRSDMTLRIEFEHDWRRGEADAEARTVGDVQEGTVDLAWIGARGFDQVGVTSFQALLAPMLVDSYDLEEAVFAAGIPAAMLAGVEDAGVRGLAVLPGPLRRVLGIDHPFVRPADFDGAVVGMQASDVAEQTFAALGASARALPSSAQLSGVDAYEQQIASIVGNHYWDVATHVTTNVNLWPRPLVVFVNPTVFDGLDAEQQEALTGAGEAVVDEAMAAARADDEPFVELCRNGMTLVAATGTELGQLRSALSPVLAALAEDAATAQYLEAIEELKDERAVAPDAVECPVDDADGADDGFVEGSFEMTLHITEALAAETGCDTDELGVVDFHLQLEDGTGTITVSDPEAGGREEVGARFTYEVFRDRVTLVDLSTGGDGMTARWSFDGTFLTFSDVRNAPACGDEVILTNQPWRRVG